MKTFQPADHLHSRTFIGLLVAQFLAAFNDQAIHAAAMFYAINTGVLSESGAITLMPILFYLPWAIFCTLSGWLADRFSKRFSLVLWKFVEVAICALALWGFWQGETGNTSLGAWVVLSTVFLMGMHSAFFVPAKYGAMPEILTPRMLSKGNGILESLSFLAVILGTVFGGILSTVYRGDEYMIGVILVGLSVLGALASLLIENIPAASAGRPFPPYVYGPLFKNLREMLTSRPLVFATVGIAFFTFLVAYMRAVVYMHGQSQLPPWSEAKTSEIVGVVALGVGIGSPLVGWLSGGKVEIGLVPLGALGMVAATCAAAYFLADVPLLIVCIGFVGFFTGFYLVPLFSLLQHRAPKASKGDFIATSNFVNIVGAIASSALFGVVGWAAVETGFTPAIPQKDEPVAGILEKIEMVEGHPSSVEIGGKTFVANEKEAPFVLIRVGQSVRKGDDVKLRTYQSGEVTYLRVQRADEPERPSYDKSRLPSLLFLSAAGMTLLTLGLLWLFLPDVFTRARIWSKTRFATTLEVGGMLRLPGSGPAVLVTDAATAEARDHVVSAADRVVHYLRAERGDDFEASAREGKRLLEAGEVVGVCLTTGEPALAVLEELLRDGGEPILPVHHASTAAGVKGSRTLVVAGSLLAPGSGVKLVREELDRLREDVGRRMASGEPLEKEAAGH